MYYPFHPLHGQEVEVTWRARRVHDAATVIDPEGVQRKMPAWMLAPEAAEYHLSTQAVISASAWLRLCDLLGVEAVLDTDQETRAGTIDDSHGARAANKR